VARSLAWAGIALIWVFKTDGPTGPVVPGELVTPGLYLAIGLALDLAQYVYGSLAWGAYHRWKEHWRRVSETEEFLAPRSINWPSNAFFWLKLLAIAFAYYFLVGYLAGRYLAG
jgi:hypothetical protein